MPYFWARQNLQKPEEKAIGFAYTFLGIRIQCAQCHKHPFDQWSKEDFDDFRNFFGTVRSVPNGPPPGDRAAQEDYKKIVASLEMSDTKLNGNQLRNEFVKKLSAGQTVPFPEVIAGKVAANAQRRPANKKNGEGPTGPNARVLGGEEIDLTKVDDARQPLMDWLRQPSNPYFAKAFVNRVWSNYFNVGIVDPPDDLSLANPPSNRPLLDHLAKGFIEHGFDMQWVHREICNSRTYQLSWQTNETNAKDERNFARCVPRRLPAEVAVDAVQSAVTFDAKAATALTELKGRAIAVAGASARSNQGQGARGDTGFALQVFGRNIRESNCDCDRSMEASLLQTVFLQNDSAVLKAIDQDSGSWLAQITKPAAKNSSARGSGANNLAQMKARLEQARKNGNKLQAAKAEERIAELQKALGGDAKEESPDAGGLTIDEQTVVRQAYLRTLTRLPTADEMDRCLAYLAQADSPAAGAKGLLWTLLNTKEFIVNH
jgi:HPt (histidine-containing phosphotransfer) domain-containing protein